MRVLFFISFLFLFDCLLRFVLLCLRAIKSAKTVGSKSETANSFAGGCVVLIAAHDEAGTIGATVAELKDQIAEWPNSSLWVVADRCSDATAEEAAAAGSEIAVRSDGKLGKGAVIAWWMEHHKSVWQTKDAVVVLDADSRIKPSSLLKLREVMANGADAAQMFVSPDADTASGR